jgi:HPt (histidine-containing phosphotransfer) domain-containing protein
MHADPSIDAVMRELAGDDPEFVAGLLSTYLAQAGTLLAQLRAAADAPAFIRAAHALTGASLNVGAERVATLCRRIERGFAVEVDEVVDAVESVRAGLRRPL